MENTLTCGAMWFETRREGLDIMFCLLVHSRRSLSRCETALEWAIDMFGKSSSLLADSNDYSDPGSRFAVS